MRKVMWSFLGLVAILLGCDRPSGYVHKGDGWHYGDAMVTLVRGANAASFNPVAEPSAHTDEADAADATGRWLQGRRIGVTVGAAGPALSSGSRAP